jgi:magnesium transporter
MAGSGIYQHLLLPDLRLMLQENDADGLKEFCEALYPVVVAEVLEGMDVGEAWRVLNSCSIERQAEIFEFIDPPQQLEMVQEVDRKQLSKLIEVMAPDDRVDLLEHLDADQIEELLPLVAQAEREDIRKLLSYSDASCGSIMTTEYASLPESITVRVAIDRLRQQAPDRETIYYVFIVDEARHLQGVITLRELILARPGTLLSAVMRREFVSVRVDDPKEAAARELARFDLLALPVVDDEQRLVGIITHDDVLDLVQEEAEEDAYRQSAIEPLENDYFSTALGTIARKRGVWLLTLAVMSMVTGGVQVFFRDVSHRHAWMQVFLSLVLATGGNMGSQSATLVIRAMAVKSLTRSDRWGVLRRELLTGLLLGLCLGVFIFVGVLAVFGFGVEKSAVVGVTVSLVVVLGAITGGVLPLIFDALKMDPAIMSNPLIASVSDMMATAIYFTIAILMLDRWLS